MLRMLSAYILTPDGKTDRLSSLEALRPCANRVDAQIWVDIEGDAPGEVRQVAEWFRLDPAAVQDCLTGDLRARIDDFETYLFLILYGAVGVEVGMTFAPRKLAVFCGEKFLITIHTEPHRSIRAIHARCDRNATPLLSRGAGHILYLILDTMVGNYVALTDAYEQQLDELEEKSLAAEREGEVLAGIVPLRRELTELRRRASGVREVIAPIAHDEYDILPETIEHRFDHLIDHLTDVVETIDAQRDVLHAIVENHHATLAHRTNQTIRVLTVLATSLLPMSVMAGIYGMNLPTWPAATNPWSFWVVLAVMAIVGTSTLLLFKRWKLW